MEMLFIVLHSIFGLGAFAGSLMLVVSFKEKFFELTRLQKASILVTVFSLFATLAVTMFAKGDFLMAIIFVLLGILACGYLSFAKTKTAQK